MSIRQNWKEAAFFRRKEDGIIVIQPLTNDGRDIAFYLEPDQKLPGVTYENFEGLNGGMLDYKNGKYSIKKLPDKAKDLNNG